MAKSSSSPLTRRDTLRLAAGLIRQFGPISQPELARRMRVSRAAVNSHLSVLRESGLVTTVGSDQGALGRPAVLLAIDEEANGFASVILDNRRLLYGLVDMGQRVLWQETEPVDESIDNAGLLSLLESCFGRLRQKAAAGKITLRYVVICVAGKIDPLTGSVEASVHFPNLHHVPLEEHFSQHLGIPLKVLYDSHAVCAGVLTACHSDVEQIGVIEWGAGITWMCASPRTPFGMVFPNWRPIGHVRVVPGGRRCYCGGQGCIEAEVGGRGILKQLAESDPALSGLDMESLRTLIEAKDPTAIAAVEASAERLGRYISFIIQMSNPQQLVVESHFGGDLRRWQEAFQRGLMPELHSAQADRLQVEFCPPETIPKIAGAASLASRLFFEQEIIHQVRFPSGYVVDDLAPEELPFSEILRQPTSVGGPTTTHIT